MIGKPQRIQRKLNLKKKGEPGWRSWNTAERALRHLSKPHKMPVQRRRRKKGEIPKLKEKLEALQKQVVIRLYGTLCYTHNPKPTDTKTKQLGHMPWARAELSQTCIYDYRFTRIQCGQCNGFGQGMSMTAKERMTAEGINLDELWALNLATKGKPHKKDFYQNKITEYTALIEELKKDTGNPQG